MKKFFLNLVILIIIIFCFNLDGFSQKIKKITELNKGEVESINAICGKVLDDYFGNKVIAWYKNTLYYYPEFEKTNGDLKPLGRIQLNTPIELSSALVKSYFSKEEARKELKNQVLKKAISYGGYDYQIINCYVQFSSDQITILPYEIYIE
jgi:hypothetical protein